MLNDLCFEIIETCPNECIFCSSCSSIYKKQIILFDDFKRVIDYFMKESGIKEISFSGGEPFLHPFLFQMVEYAKSLGIRTVIFTSGVVKSKMVPQEYTHFYTEEMNRHLKEIDEHEPWNDRLKNHIQKYYEKCICPSKFSEIKKDDLFQLKKIGLDKIVFDYQAYESETDRYLMGRSEEKRICFLNSLFNASRVGLETDVHFVPMKPNYMQIPDILEMLEIIKINQISILQFIPQGRGFDHQYQLQLTETELNQFKQLLETSRSIYSGQIRFGTSFLDPSVHKCNAGFDKLVIKFDGTVLPCPAFKELDLETMNQYGIKYYNIYENLSEISILEGCRREPLCRKIYKK